MYNKDKGVSRKTQGQKGEPKTRRQSQKYPPLLSSQDGFLPKASLTSRRGRAGPPRAANCRHPGRGSQLISSLGEGGKVRYLSEKLFTSSHTMTGRFSRSLYVGKSTEYLSCREARLSGSRRDLAGVRLPSMEAMAELCVTPEAE